MARKKKTTRKIKGGVPGVQVFAACDAVSRDPNTGKPSLYGLFDSIYSAKFPATARPFCLFAKLSGDGRYRIALELVSPDEQVDKLGEVTVQCTRRQYSILEMSVAGLKLKKPGYYGFRLRANNRLIGQPCWVQLKRARKK